MSLNYTNSTERTSVTKALKAKQELEAAQKEARSAVESFSGYQTKYKDVVISIFEKMALYSAGIISLSVTFLGYLLSKDHLVLTETFICLPIYFYLYLSWASFALNLIISLFIKWTDTLYLFWNSQLYYHKTRKILEEKRIEFFKSYPNIIFSADKDKESETAVCRENIKILNGSLVAKTSKKEQMYFFLSKWLQRLAILMFILGTVLLIVFATTVTFLLINKS